MTEIDKNIPIPADGEKYPWGQMDVGDSFLTVGPKLTSMRSTASAKGAKLGKFFLARKVDDGVRVWRVK